MLVHILKDYVSYTFDTNTMYVHASLRLWVTVHPRMVFSMVSNGIYQDKPQMKMVHQLSPRWLLL